jgi:hypothetical protein
MKLPDQLETIQIDALIPYAPPARRRGGGPGGGGSVPDMAECSLHASWA